MGAQVPELLQADAGDVDDVVGLRDRGRGVVAVAQVRAEGHYELDEVLVEREEAQHSGRGGRLLGVVVVDGCFRGGLGIGGHGFGVEGRDLEDIDGDAALIWRTVKDIFFRAWGCLGSELPLRPVHWGYCTEIDQNAAG